MSKPSQIIIITLAFTSAAFAVPINYSVTVTIPSAPILASPSLTNLVVTRA